MISLCIIIYKNNDVDKPTEKVLTTCLKAHKDGFGAMWRVGDKIRIVKGLYDIHSIKKIVDHIPKNAEAALHFRQSTHGVVSAGNCHPFPLSGRTDALTTVDGYFDNGLVHNGIISGFGDRNSSSHSDTMNFIKYLERATGKIYTMTKLKRHIPDHYGKFVIFTPTYTYFFGQFYDEKKLKYSNTSYRDFTDNWGCCGNKRGFLDEGIDYRHWDPDLQCMVYGKDKPKPTPKLNSVPAVIAVNAAEVKWTEGSDVAEYNGKKGAVFYYQGTTIFCEEGYDKIDLEIMIEDIAVAIAEGEDEQLNKWATP